MRYLVAVSAFAILTACGTRPPLPPECKGALSPINTPAGNASAGAMHESRTEP